MSCESSVYQCIGLYFYKKPANVFGLGVAHSLSPARFFITCWKLRYKKALLRIIQLSSSNGDKNNPSNKIMWGYYHVYAISTWWTAGLHITYQHERTSLHHFVEFFCTSWPWKIILQSNQILKLLGPTTCVFDSPQLKNSPLCHCPYAW